MYGTHRARATRARTAGANAPAVLLLRALLCALLLCDTHCGRAPSRVGRQSADAVRESATGEVVAGGRAAAALAYAGHDAHGIPHYARDAARTLGAADRALLRDVYGITDPALLYRDDSTADGLLKYDTRVKTCLACYVNSYRVGFVSIRRPGESWEALERRLRTMAPADFPAWARTASVSTADLDPRIRGDVERMLADARRAGFALRITATYRSPTREALLMAEGGSRTHTLTSLHSYGRAIDLAVGDGNLRRAATRARWVAFRRWVQSYGGGEFRILGTPQRTWDWPHVEVEDTELGFRSIDAALARARACRAPGAAVPCDFVPHLPPGARP